jgi:phosphatidylinositol-3-phosphatase
MENEDSSSIVGSSSAPYINGTLLKDWAYTTAYTAITHPSLPNYVALTSGGTQGIVCDCQPVGSPACTSGCAVESSPTCNCGGLTATSIGDQLTTAGLMWRNYGEDMGTACNTANSGNYAVRHVPFLYYASILNSDCAAHVVDFTNFAGDLGKYSYSFITPNLCDDGHDDCTGSNTTPDEVSQSDTWLQTNVPTITSAPGFSTNGVLFITWDEGSDTGTNTVLTIAIGPLVKPGAVSTAYTHYSMLATIEDGLGLARIGGAVGATPMAAMFK